MECERVANLLPEYSVGALTARQRDGIEAHLAGCAACRRELGALEATERLLCTLPAMEPSRALWPGISEAIRARGVRAPWWRRVLAPPRRGWTVAIAAAVMVLVLAVGILPNRTGTPTQLTYQPDPESAVYAEWYAAAAWNSPLADRSAMAVTLAYAPAQEESVP